jgi:hypothetical protein
MKKIVRLRQLTLSRYKRVYRTGATNRCTAHLAATDSASNENDDVKPHTLPLFALTSFVIDERNIRQRTRSRNFLWWLVQTDSVFQN